MKKSFSTFGYVALGLFILVLGSGQIRAADNPFPPDGIDHLMFAAPSLEQGMDDIEALLGVRPVPGGHHPQYGTHNALLSLGPGMYLEVIARDPSLPEPENGVLVELPDGAPSQLITWIYRTADIDGAVIAANAKGAGLGQVETGSRKTPAGTIIRWQLTNPSAMPMEGAIPFLINWGNTPHPSLVVPAGGRLTALRIYHPDPDSVGPALGALGADVSVIEANSFRLEATIETAEGVVTLR